MKIWKTFMVLGSLPYMGGEARVHSEKVQKNTDGGFQSVVARENIQLYTVSVNKCTIQGCTGAAKLNFVNKSDQRRHS